MWLGLTQYLTSSVLLLGLLSWQVWGNRWSLKRSVWYEICFLSCDGCHCEVSPLQWNEKSCSGHDLLLLSDLWGSLNQLSFSAQPLGTLLQPVLRRGGCFSRTTGGCLVGLSLYNIHIYACFKWAKASVDNKLLAARFFLSWNLSSVCHVVQFLHIIMINSQSVALQLKLGSYLLKQGSTHVP